MLLALHIALRALPAFHPSLLTSSSVPEGRVLPLSGSQKEVCRMMSAVKVSRCLKLVSAQRSSNLQNVLLSTTSTCPITGTSSSKSSFPQENGSHGKFEDIPGPNIYPIVGSLQDFQKNGGNLRDTAHVYYKKYGMISKQNITGNEIIVYDPREHLKGSVHI